VIAQSATTLQANRINAAAPSQSSSSGSFGFGDALVKATAAGARNAANAATESHAVKKPVDKKADVAPANGSKNQKATPATDVQPPVTSASKPLATSLPLQPMATGEKMAADEATSSEDVVVTREGSSDNAMSALSATAGSDGAARVTDGSAKPEGPSSVAASSTIAGAKRPVALHQAAIPHTAGAKVNAIQGQDSDGQDDSPDGVTAVGASGGGNAASDDDGQVASSGAAPGSDADTSLMFGAALSTLPATVLDAGVTDPGLNGIESTGGLDLNAGELSPVTNGVSKSSAPSGGLVATKSKGESSEVGSVTPSGAASFQKVAEAVQPAAPTVGGTGAHADVVAVQTSTQAGSAEGTSHVDSKSGQHGSGDASAESSGTALTSAAPQSWDASATQVVHRAQLIQAMHQSEMRMGMNSAEFGSISISAAVTHQTLSAQISLDHVELSRALMAQLPEIEKRLGSAYGLPSRVEVRDSSSSSQQGSSRHDGDSLRGSVRGISNASQSALGSTGFASESAPTTTYSTAAGMRLDILI